MSKQLLKLS